MPFYRCSKCKLYIPNKRTCQIMIPQMQGKISPEDYCSQIQTEIEYCEICGGGLLVPIIETIGDEVHIYCQNCLIQRKNNEKSDDSRQNS